MQHSKAVWEPVASLCMVIANWMNYKRFKIVITLLGRLLCVLITELKLVALHIPCFAYAVKHLSLLKRNVQFYKPWLLNVRRHTSRSNPVRWRFGSTSTNSLTCAVWNLFGCVLFPHLHKSCLPCLTRYKSRYIVFFSCLEIECV